MEHYIAYPCDMYDIRMLLILLRLRAVCGPWSYNSRLCLWRSCYGHYSGPNDTLDKEKHKA